MPNKENSIIMSAIREPFPYRLTLCYVTDLNMETTSLELKETPIELCKNI